MIARRLRSLVSSVRFLIINMKAFAALPRFAERDLPEGMIFRGCRRSEVKEVLALRKQLDGHELSWAVRLVLKSIPGKCCVVIYDSQGVLNALSLFYFNERDTFDATVHEGFIGVRTQCVGKGLATKVRRLAADHFSQAPTIQGISSRITLSNLASVSSGYRAGYELLETYRDESAGDERGYFVNRFRYKAQS